MAIDMMRVRQALQSFDLHTLFVQELGWNNPKNPRSIQWSCKDVPVRRREIANLAGVVVFEVTTDDGTIPDETLRRAIAHDVAQLHLENLLIFLNRERTGSLWYWVKREGGKTYPRRHTFVQGQPGDLLISKLSAMFVDIGELDANGNIPLIDVARRLRQALDIEPVTRKFFDSFKELHQTLLGAIDGIAEERDRRWYASALLNRLMFIYFLQRKGFLDGGDRWYLQRRLEQSRARGDDRFYGEFLRALFFEGFARPGDMRDPAAQALIGDIRYLNGGLFLPHQVEQHHAAISIPDAVFERILELFAAYSWNLDDTLGGDDNEINPAVLGYIFEKYINQKAFGAYYTRPEITEYLCEQTIHRLILDAVNASLPPGAQPYDAVGDLLLSATAQTCRLLLLKVLPELKLIDPACGSGAFLVAAMKTLIEVYSALVGKVKFLKDSTLSAWLAGVERGHPSIDYFIKKQIIINNLFGVDIMAEATEIARLRLFLALVGSAQSVEDLEPLPNIDFNILAGNSLIGLLRVDERKADAQQAIQMNMFQKPYHEIVAEKNRLIASYRNAAERLRAEDLGALRDDIQRHRDEAAELLDDLLLNEFQELKIRYEQATWDAAKGKAGKPARRALTKEDIRALQPFHWGYEFDEVMNERGGFDAIITNPPWEIFKPNAKEFLGNYSNLVSRKMTIKESEDAQTALLQDPEIRDARLSYLSRFPHLNAFFRSTTQYENQIATYDGKKASTDINFYKLFIEQCYNLLRENGQCGIIIPSGLYTDLGAKQLREMLFSRTNIREIFGLSNERYIFENVHHGFRFCILVFEKGSSTENFQVAFRINPREAVQPDQLESFLNAKLSHIMISTSIIRKLSPDSLSLLEFKLPQDIEITSKIIQYPLLGEKIRGTWNITLCREFHMTDDNHLYKDMRTLGRLPLYEGKMINQFDHRFAQPKYWLDETEARAELLKKRRKDIDQRLNASGIPANVDTTLIKLDYENYRVAFRDVAASTNERCMISTVLPPKVFCPHTMSLEAVYEDKLVDGKLILNHTTLNNPSRLFLVAVLNSFPLDYLLRQRVTNHVSFFLVYNLPVPRLTEKDPAFAPIVERAARLICTTPEYDDLAREVGLGDHSAGVTDAAERARLRAELDAMVAHLYGLTEAELAHILGTFPLVEQAQKDAVLTEYRRRAPNPDDAQVAALIADGESERVEFKVAALWNPRTSQRDGSMRENIVQGVAAFLNSAEGGALILGVENATNRVVGLDGDYAAANPQKRDRDGYELWLRDAIGAGLGQAVGVYYSISFHIVGGAEVCRIQVRPAGKPVYYNGDLYVRIGNGKKKLSAQQAIEYVRGRWAL
jgi:Eco57I restriction-modification methylase/Schlafen, AlbA_2